MIWLAAVTLILSLGLVGIARHGYTRLRRAAELCPAPIDRFPKISIVVAARNEAAGIEAALESLLALEYPELEWIVVDDRSDDGTSEVLSSLAARHRPLTIVRVDRLPAGWLGKNHALARGVERASGEWILFTDADVVYKDPTLLVRLVAQALADGTDHVTCVPRLRSGSALCEAFIAFYCMTFMLYFRPWAVRDPKSRGYVGVGAFNLFKKAALEAAGGMAAIRLRPDDDVKLGKILKRSGHRTELVTATDELECEWHPSLGSCLRGLEKSIFPGMDYRVAEAWLAALWTVLFHVLPFLSPLFAEGPALGLWLLAAMAQVYLLCWVAERARLNPVYGFLAPLSALFSVWAILRNTALVLWRGGIEWRGTFYSLEELRSNPV
jgi:hypothetical protein